MTNARKSFTRKNRNETNKPKKKQPSKLSCKWSQVTILSTTKKTTKHLVQQEQRTWTIETLLAPLNDSRN